MLLKSVNTLAIATMLGFAFLILLFFSFFQYPSASTSIPSLNMSTFLNHHTSDPFRDLLGAFKKWDSQVGCSSFRETHKGLIKNGSSSLQDVDGDLDCGVLQMRHVEILVKGWTWIPDNLDNLYSCRCGLSCLWTKSSILADKPDALLFETTTPPLQVLLIFFSSMLCFSCSFIIIFSGSVRNLPISLHIHYYSCPNRNSTVHLYVVVRSGLDQEPKID